MLQSHTGTATMIKAFHWKKNLVNTEMEYIDKKKNNAISPFEIPIALSENKGEKKKMFSETYFKAIEINIIYTWFHCNCSKVYLTTYKIHNYQLHFVQFHVIIAVKVNYFYAAVQNYYSPLEF